MADRYQSLTSTPVGKFLVKNQFEHGWMANGLPPALANPMFPETYNLLLRAVDADTSDTGGVGAWEDGVLETEVAPKA